MTTQEVFEAIRFFGNACEPGIDEHDTKTLCAEVICQLPADVQNGLIFKTSHIFIGGSGQLGEYIELMVPTDEINAGLAKLRIIFLSEQVMKLPRNDALHTIAHEIAHSRCDYHGAGGLAREKEADALAAEWGFFAPASRAEVLRDMEQAEAKTRQRQ